MQPNGTPEAPNGSHSWHPALQFAFRCAFVFFSLLCLKEDFAGLLFGMWPWLHRHVNAVVQWPFYAPIEYLFRVKGLSNASQLSDTVGGWLIISCIFVVSLVAGAAWTLCARRSEYRTLHAWFTLMLRLVLAAALINYGFIKVFPLQMPPPTADMLAQTYGSSTPFRLLWMFMGVSPVYRIFGGLVEVIAGVLLIFRRTAALGILMSVAVLTNVVLMNLGYDVGVKLSSMELLLTALFLAPYLQGFWRFFISQQATALYRPVVPYAERRPLFIMSRALQVLLVFGILHGSVYTPWKAWQAAHTLLQGTWVVDSADGSLAPLHWETVASTQAWAYWMQAGPAQHPQTLLIQILPRKKAVQFVNRDNHGEITGDPYAELHWTDEVSGRLTLTGMWRGMPGSVTMHRTYPPETELMSHHIHWIQR